MITTIQAYDTAVESAVHVIASPLAVILAVTGAVLVAGTLIMAVDGGLTKKVLTILGAGIMLAEAVVFRGIAATPDAPFELILSRQSLPVIITLLVAATIAAAFMLIAGIERLAHHCEQSVAKSLTQAFTGDQRASLPIGTMPEASITLGVFSRYGTPA